MDCAKFIDLLIRQTQHIDQELIKDRFPTDSAWLGHVRTGKFPSNGGAIRTFERMHVAMPNATGCRETISTTSCIGTPCDPVTKQIGFGSTAKTYQETRERWKTQLFCWDQSWTADFAREQYMAFFSGLKDSTTRINSDHLRFEALNGAETIHIAGASKKTVSVSINATNCNELVIGAGNLPTSQLTMPYLMSFIEPLRLTGYFRESNGGEGQDLPVKMPVARLVTDEITSRRLREGNPALSEFFRFSDFEKGGSLYSYGITSGVGNFGISIDDYPWRFQQVSGTTLQRILPYTNVAATLGIKPQLNTAYTNASLQISFIWHPDAMKLLARDPTAIPNMPFLNRDQMGKWNFVMDNMSCGTDSNGNPIMVDNIARNKGLWFADFRSAIKYERPELVRAILHLRAPECMVDDPICSSVPAYVEQSYTSSNDVC